MHNFYEYECVLCNRDAENREGIVIPNVIDITDGEDEFSGNLFICKECIEKLKEAVK